MATSSVQSGAEVPGSVSLRDLVQPFAKNWNTPIPDAPQEGRSWSIVTVEDKKYLNHAGKDLYSYDTNDWALAKSIGVIFTAHIYLGASFLRHAGLGLYATAKSLQDIYLDYKALRGEADFKLKTFALNHLSSFSAAGKEFKQAGKDIAPIVAFSVLSWFSLPLIGVSLSTTATALAVAYAAYAPLDARVQLNRLEQWHRQEGVQPLTDQRVEKLSAMEYLNEATKGSISLGQIFKMNRQFAVVKEHVEEQDKPKTE